MRSLVALALFAACADPVVEMQFMLPNGADNFDTTCINAVEVRVTGGNYLTDKKDYKRSCIEISSVAGYAAIRDAIKGKFEVEIPSTGMSGIEIYGWSGPTPCDVAGRDDPWVSPNLLFMGRGDYIGQDRVDIPITPNLSCSRSQVKIRAVEMLSLAGGATCLEAGAPDAIGATGMGIGTLAPRMFGKGTQFFGNLDGADAIAGVSTFSAPTQIGPKACLAVDAGDGESSGSTGCLIGGGTVCAGAGELEMPQLAWELTASSENYDTTLMTKFPGIVLGTVWSNATPKALVAGATVAVDPNHGKVVYLEPPNAVGVMLPRADQSATGPAGLFMLYTDTLISAKVTTGTATRTVTLGSIPEDIGAAMIVVP